jgi:hypothetical protein
MCNLFSNKPSVMASINLFMEVISVYSAECIKHTNVTFLQNLVSLSNQMVYIAVNVLRRIKLYVRT